MEPVVEVTGGRVRGARRRGVTTFSGIPYAGPPTGRRRWRPPTPPEPWSGVLECEHFGPIAPQSPPIPGMSLAGEPDEHSEDCLTVNVWTPAPDGARRPVMVWVHGGGFTSGSGAGNLYRGGTLARDGDVVVVTLNYRLGALGWLAHPALGTDPEGEPWSAGSDGSAWRWAGFGNWGLADQVAALRWVRDHIAEFGGDPGNVTVFGESAGAMSISALLGVPAARGLFHRAVVQSGPIYTHTPEQAARSAEGLASRLGVPLSREALERVPADLLVTTVAEMSASVPLGDGLPLPFLPVVDGGLLPAHPGDALGRGDLAEVPLVVGTTRDEAAFFAVTSPEVSNLDLAGVVAWVRKAVPECIDPEGVVEAYRAARARRGEGTSGRDVWVSLMTDAVFRLPTVRLADAHANGWRARSGSVGEDARAVDVAGTRSGAGTYAYLFTWETPAFGGQLGSCHALEIPFVFGTVEHPSVQLFSGGGDEALALSRDMRERWASFAHGGDPSPQGDWPAWDPARRPTMVFGPWPGDGASSPDGMPCTSRAVDGPRDEELQVLAASISPVVLD